MPADRLPPHLPDGAASRKECAGGQRSDLVARARAFATRSHARINHLRKYSLAPYDVHLERVADLVASVTDDEEAIAAAWLHDVVEDTPVTFEEIEAEFGAGVTQLVMELTDVSTPGDGNRAARKARDREHLAGASHRAKTVKLADLIDNTEDIGRNDPRFARVYCAEMELLMAFLTEGDATLFARARESLEGCRRKVIEGPRGSMPGNADERQAFSSCRGIRLFTVAFTARDVLEPLLSVDLGASPEAVEKTFARSRGSVVGLREEGEVTGYLVAATGEAAWSTRAVSPRQILGIDASLTEVIHLLTLFDVCFVGLEGSLVGTIGRLDMEKPAVRMWLFGMIMLIEMVAVDHIRRRWPDGAWTRQVSEGRLQKALHLQQERLRRNRGADLLDCMQFSDKLQIFLQEPEFLANTGFASLKAARKAIKDLESLRNDLAHGQEVSRHDWPSIIRLVRRIDGIFVLQDR